ncbi:hypothetical protein [Zunongwangia sp. HRR-M8]|uniref:hypothetical protein n=1 Tax=Zunongwangia sp. HRR-M8 TaxID=3015170 RepID=UPI0022DCF8BC|nr:hypothetical protein [Zunongwangia sp. HRR-M8]WBL20760.1 hypothetical protein PBT89_08435 [Zunongwangia sp. HRR-M8]|tara:strand:- start:4416 stop:4646 length:231 start_codon:yes stop_codon:yes gene_type:complete
MARRRRSQRSRRTSTGIQSSNAKRMVNSALRAKGKGSVTRVWRQSRNAARAGNIGLAVSLGNIAKRKAAYASRMKR